jgi:hypothetical protein
MTWAQKIRAKGVISPIIEARLIKKEAMNQSSLPQSNFTLEACPLKAREKIGSLGFRFRRGRLYVHFPRLIFCKSITSLCLNSTVINRTSFNTAIISASAGNVCQKREVKEIIK